MSGAEWFVVVAGLLTVGALVLEAGISGDSSLVLGRWDANKAVPLIGIGFGLTLAAMKFADYLAG